MPQVIFKTTSTMAELHLFEKKLSQQKIRETTCKNTRENSQKQNNLRVPNTQTNRERRLAKTSIPATKKEQEQETTCINT